MPLHLIKLAVGAESLADLREWMAERMAEAKRRRAPLRHAHITRMAPKRTEQILDGGSLYWVVKGLISARQEIVGLEPFVDADGYRPLQDLAWADRGRGRAAADARLPGLALLSRPRARRRISTRPSPASPPCRRGCAASWRRSGCCKFAPSACRLTTCAQCNTAVANWARDGQGQRRRVGEAAAARASQPSSMRPKRFPRRRGPAADG